MLALKREVARMRKQCAPPYRLPASVLYHSAIPRSHSQTAMLFGNSLTAGRRKSTAGPKCIAAGAATKCEAVHGAKVCSPPARFPGEHCASRSEVDVEEGGGRGGGSALCRDPASRESQRIAALKAADCHDFTVSVPL